MAAYIGTFAYLEGEPNAIGKQQALEFRESVQCKESLISRQPTCEKEYRKRKSLLEEYCPGMNEELEGFAKEMGCQPHQLTYYTDSWLTPGGCSLGAILRNKMEDNKTYMLRNYDLTPDISDLRLCTTKVKGKYTHTGFSVSTFGRSDGLNEKGLCVAFASCGMPIGHHPGMRAPAVDGLQFMVVVRTLLETSKNIQEAIYALNNMPIGTNMNLLMADANGEAALVGTYDGIKTVKKTEMDYIVATNHGLFPEIERLEQGKLEQSEIRYQLIEDKLSTADKISTCGLKELISTEYPEGLTVHNYKEHFGTVHSILFNLTDRQIEFSFGSPVQNSFYKMNVGEHFPNREIQVEFENKSYGPEFWRLVR
ncbi:putative choloylglycine hydrolase [Sporosarcina luteola]|nr:putative choloylglycine hydrolase [Sporosarcina luteola]